MEHFLKNVVVLGGVGSVIEIDEALLVTVSITSKAVQNCWCLVHTM
jgi:hypothetical protein